MLEVAKMPLARRLWKISKFYGLPLNDERIQQLDTWDMDFIEYSMLVDDPKKLEQYENHFSDPDFDDWVAEFELEQELKQQDDGEFDEELSVEENTNHASESRNLMTESTLEHDEDFEESIPSGLLDWEEVD